jgi:hypothetical protein
MPLRAGLPVFARRRSGLHLVSAHRLLSSFFRNTSIMDQLPCVHSPTSHAEIHRIMLESNSHTLGIQVEIFVKKTAHLERFNFGRRSQ